MIGKSRIFFNTFILIGLTIVLSACGTKFAKGDPYYYSLTSITGGENRADEINLYIVDPFEKKVYATSHDTDEEDWLYDLKQYEDKENTLTFKYNGVTENLEKKSSSLWKSLNTGLEYDVKKYYEKPDYRNIDSNTN